MNRVFDSAGPEGKVRGTPQQIIEKYTQLADDARLANDRVAAESFQQHAEHYTRLLSQAQREVDARREQQEREHRERQQQRNENQQTSQQQRAPQNAPQTGGDAAPTADVPAQTDSVDLSQVDQPELAQAQDVDNGLVETPEQSPKPAAVKRRPRKPKVVAPVVEPAAESDAGGETTKDSQPETPEAAQ